MGLPTSLAVGFRVLLALRPLALPERLRAHPILEVREAQQSLVKRDVLALLRFNGPWGHIARVI